MAVANIQDKWQRYTGRRSKSGAKLYEKNPQTWGKGKRYKITWDDENGQRQYHSEDRYEDARAYLASVTVQKHEGTYIARTDETVAEFGKRFLAMKDWSDKPGTKTTVLSHWNNHVLPDLGEFRLRDISNDHIKAAHLKWKGKLAPATVRNVYGLTVAIFRTAEEQRKIPRSPCFGIKMAALKSAEERAHKRLLTFGDLEYMVSRIDRRFVGMIWLGAFSGLRPAEMRGLIVDRVTFNPDGTSVIKVDRQLRSTKPTWGPPKTAAGFRDVPMGRFGTAKLREHMAEFPPHSSGLIFTSVRGNPVAHTSAGEAWTAAAEGLDLEARQSWHQLRHFNVSMLVKNNVMISVIAKLLGHASIQETLDTYTGVWKTDMNAGAAAMDEAYAEYLAGRDGEIEADLLAS